MPFMIKIGIEGFEVALFSANTGWIETFPLRRTQRLDATGAGALEALAGTP